MRILKGIEIPLTICVSYTILSITNAVLHLSAGEQEIAAANSLMMLVWTGIAVLILSLHPLFERWSPLTMILCQYFLAVLAVLMTVYVSGFFEALHPMAYRDAFLSFSVPYGVGGVVYYISLFRAAARQNRLLQEIKEQRKQSFTE